MSKRKFNTVKEIYEAYLPGYKALSEETLAESEIGLGNQLALNLIEEFRVGLRERTPVFTSEKASEE